MRQIKWLLLLTLFLTAVLATDFYFFATRPQALPAQPYQFTLKPGTSLKGAAQQLQQEGGLSNVRMFVVLARLLGKSAQIKAGNYVLETAVTPLELLDVLAKGKGIQSEFSVIEGWTFGQFRAVLNASPAVRHDTAQLSAAEILQRLGVTETHPEGLFFPDTYHFASGASDLTLFKRAYETMQKHVQQAWQTREPGLPLESPYQALILASIVEKETGAARDRGMIAGVFTNRLHKGMLLQTDPTVIYGVGEKFDGNLKKRDLLADTPYNTYTRAGLPPTPIALPGLASIQAALHPAKTDALYFVARGDGSSEFSATLAKHNRAVNKYQK
ncbi:MAG: hypothetical protein FD134_1086 [Gallionellaceae bacterium]|nr:MAG: hypothetical protein FD134_1086 [Gallionellaceae bacterium]